MFKLIRNLCLLGMFLIPAAFVTINYSKNYCSQPNRHCIGEKYISLWEKWWSQFERNYIYITFIRLIHPAPIKKSGINSNHHSPVQQLHIEEVSG